MIAVPNDYPRLEHYATPAAYFAALDDYADRMPIPRLFDPETWADWHGRRQAEGWLARLRRAVQ